MVRRFEKDDQGYVAWLAAHPDGYVLNTNLRVRSDYLVLHLARCRTVNRPLAAGRRWTDLYGKTCDDDRAAVEAWAMREGGQAARPCGQCLGGSRKRSGRRVPAPSIGRSHEPRRPGRNKRAIDMRGDGVTVRIDAMKEGAVDAPPLVIEGAQWLAETFFRRDASAVGSGSYDAWIEETQGDPERRDRIVDGDVTAVNSTMAARTPHAVWAEVIAADEWPWLDALDPSWGLFEMDDAEWQLNRVHERLAAAFAAVKRPGLHIAVITKVLHIKRPGLIPVLDSLVIGQVGGRVTDDVATWVAVTEHVRRVGRSNLGSLRAIRDHLRSERLPERSLLRILDSLLWTCAPGSALSGELAGWERVFRPRARSRPAVVDAGPEDLRPASPQPGGDSADGASDEMATGTRGYRGDRAGEIVRELLAPAGRVPAAAFPRAGDPAHLPGLYAWFVDGAGAAHLAAGLGVPVAPGLIYAGQAGAGTSTATLRSRIRGNHLGGTITGSTFRLTLASVLAPQLGLVDGGGRALEAYGEARLTAWMRDHLEVAIAAAPERAQVAELEGGVLARLDPPLNLQGMGPSPVRSALTALRRGRPRRASQGEGRP